MADTYETDALDDEETFNTLPPPDEREWWVKQLGRTIDLREPEPALH